ncbi:hypothetical protein AXW83_12930 [Bosea sp. PAMC 26642]|nr:hypothetical protein AXW83_12930 [Bosea sp. PAMC 26642]
MSGTDTDACTSCCAASAGTIQLGVLVLKLLQTLGFGHVHPSELRFPVVEGRLGDTVLARQIGGLRPGLMLAQNRDDLLFRNRARFICPSLRKAGL